MKASRGPAKSSSETPSYATKTTRRNRGAVAVRNGSISGIYVIAAQAFNGYFEIKGTGRNNMAKVAVLVADAFQDSEYFLPKIEIEKLGVETETVSISKSPVEIYSFFRCVGHLNIDKSIDEAKSTDYVGALVPGGAKSPAILAEDERILSFLREMNGSKKMIAPICRGTLLVVTSGIAKGREITGFHLSDQYPDLAIKPLVQKYGGLWRDDQPVIVSGNLISSRHPDDVPFFSRAIREWLQSSGSITK
jgi:protease I